MRPRAEFGRGLNVKSAGGTHAGEVEDDKVAGQVGKELTRGACKKVYPLVYW